MKKILLSILSLMITFSAASAQTFKRSGTVAARMVPVGWKAQAIKGDLNKDGVADMVVLATPPDEFVEDDFGNLINGSKPVMAIYWGAYGGRYSLFRAYDFPIDDEADKWTITDRGTLRVETYHVLADGIEHRGVLVYRYQNGDFYLIGEQSEDFYPKIGMVTVESRNYSTQKLQTLEYRKDDDSADPVETWSDIDPAPLKRLGVQYPVE